MPDAPAQADPKILVSDMVQNFCNCSRKDHDHRPFPTIGSEISLAAAIGSKVQEYLVGHCISFVAVHLFWARDTCNQLALLFSIELPTGPHNGVIQGVRTTPSRYKLSPESEAAERIIVYLHPALGAQDAQDAG